MTMGIHCDAAGIVGMTTGTSSGGEALETGYMRVVLITALFVAYGAPRAR